MEIRSGLPAGQERAAAELFWDAFGAKLGKLLGPAPRGIRFFTETINPEAIVAATDGDTLLGIAALKTGGDGFSKAGLAALFQHYGLGTLWRLPLLVVLDRAPPKGALHIEALCVNPEARGSGVGTALLAAVFDRARDAGFATVSLEVVDTNPRAKALYERIGFRAESEEQLSVLRHVVGFNTATKMVRAV